MNSTIRTVKVQIGSGPSAYTVKVTGTGEQIERTRKRLTEEAAGRGRVIHRMVTWRS